MKIVAFSDTHGQRDKRLTEWFNFNPADLLIFSGDLQRNQYDFGEDFIDWIHALPYTDKILVFGNHDGNYIYILEYAEKYPEIKFLMNSCININGINIFGSPYSVRYQDWWFMMEDKELSKIWKEIPEDTEILITHCPPFGILDSTFDGYNAGSKTLLEKINRLEKLKYHFFGHIHESYGKQNINEKIFINVSLLNEIYYFTNYPVIIDYDLRGDYNVGE